MVWLRSLTITLALGSATWAYAQATGTQPAVKDKSDNLELSLEPKDIQGGVPQTFTFVLVNTSDHDVRIPATPVVNCHSQYSGSIWLVHTFTPLTPGSPGPGGGCAASKYNWPPLMDRVKEWKVLRAGESLRIAGAKNFDDKEAGTYKFWAEYEPPYISSDDQATLRQAGIDFPHDELATAHITYVKKH